MRVRSLGLASELKEQSGANGNGSHAAGALEQDICKL